MKNLFWLSLILFSLSACNQADMELVKSKTAEAKSYMANESLDSALTIINSALELAPNDVDALLVKGKVLSLKGDYIGAIGIFDATIKSNPKVASPYLERSIASINVGNIDQAFTDINKGLAIIPGSAPLMIQKGLIHQRRGEHETAIEIFSDLYQKDTLNGRLLFLRALSKKWSKDLDGALADINQCMTLKVDNQFEVYEQRAFLYRAKGMDNDALEDMGKMIGIASRMKVTKMICAARNSRAELLIDNQQWANALNDVNKSIPLDTLNPYGLVLRARIQIAFDKIEEACADLDLAVKRDYTKLYGPTALNLQNLHCQN